MKLTKRGKAVSIAVGVAAGFVVWSGVGWAAGDQAIIEPPTADHEDNMPVVTIEPWLMDPPQDTVPDAYQPPPETTVTTEVKQCL